MIGYLIAGLIIGLIIGVVVGAAIWRNNAKKFSRIEQKANADVKAWLGKIGINI